VLPSQGLDTEMLGTSSSTTLWLPTLNFELAWKNGLGVMPLIEQVRAGAAEEILLALSGITAVPIQIN